MLLSAPYGKLRREEIVDTLWSGVDQLAAHQSLRAAIGALRRAFREPTWIRVAGPTVTLDLPGDSRDDIAFEARARASLSAGNIAEMFAALDLYGGSYLPDDRYNDWTGYRRLALSDLRRSLLLGVSASATKLGRQSDVTNWLRQLLSDDPCDEPAARALMKLLLEDGRRVDAVRTYKQLEQALRLEIEVDPEPETTKVLGSLHIVTQAK